MNTLIDQLAAFATEASFEDLPDEVRRESQRILLDSIGCSLGAVGEPKGRMGIEHGLTIGSGAEAATIIGTPHRTSVLGAAFANGELISTLDSDPVLPPGHVTPYVLPAIMAYAENLHASGEDVIAAIAVAHEMSHRLGKASDYLREFKDGQVVAPPVYGYSSTVFGATAAVCRLLGHSSEVTAHALGIAGSIAPVNTLRSWAMHPPVSTIKYLLAGQLVQTAITAASLAGLGHRGDRQILDDAEFGWRRFIGTERWVPERINDGLGVVWGFPREQSFKPYPHCRILHALLDGLDEVVSTHGLVPEEIERIDAWGESFVELPMWLSTTITHVQDAQFSIAHGLAVGAQGITPGPGWQTPEVVFSPDVLDLMDRVTYQPHPEYSAALAADPASRRSKVEVVARGRTFTAERMHPKGSPSGDPRTRMTDDELAEKFRANAVGRLDDDAVHDLLAALSRLADVPDFATVMQATAVSA